MMEILRNYFFVKSTVITAAVNITVYSIELVIVTSVGNLAWRNIIIDIIMISTKKNLKKLFLNKLLR